MERLTFTLLYLLLGVLFLLGDIALQSVRGTSFRDQIKAMLFLAEDDQIGLTWAILLYILVWPIMIIAQSGGPPTRGA
jgi:hypothetical protein